MLQLQYTLYVRVKVCLLQRPGHHTVNVIKNLHLTVQCHGIRNDLQVPYACILFPEGNSIRRIYRNLLMVDCREGEEQGVCLEIFHGDIVSEDKMRVFGQVRCGYIIYIALLMLHHFRSEIHSTDSPCLTHVMTDHMIARRPASGCDVAMI